MYLFLMVFIDANIVYHKDHPEVTLATALAAFECGFDAVVLNYICTGRPDKSDKGIPDTFVEAIHRAISDRSTAAGARAAALRVLNPARPLLRVYKRLTMVIEKKSQAQGLGQQATYLTKAYDIIAVTPLSDSVFQEVFPALDVIDIVSIDVRSTVALKRKVLNTIASKGVKLELAVAPAAEGAGGKGRSSAAQLRGPGPGARGGDVGGPQERDHLQRRQEPPGDEEPPRTWQMSAWCWGMSAETAYSAVSTAVEAMITRGFTRKSTHVGLAMVTPIKK